MHFQSLKDHSTQSEQYHCHDPEIHRGEEIPEKPFFLVDRTAIAIHDIDQRIQLQDHDPLRRQRLQIPQNGGCPHADLQSDADDLGQIPEKYHYRAGRITQCQHKYKQAEAVVHNLYRIYGRIIAVDSCHDQQETYEKYMDKSSRNNLDDRQDADLKYYFFHQIVVL